MYVSKSFSFSFIFYMFFYIVNISSSSISLFLYQMLPPKGNQNTCPGYPKGKTPNCCPSSLLSGKQFRSLSLEKNKNTDYKSS